MIDVLPPDREQRREVPHEAQRPPCEVLAPEKAR
jgi:hypothetical protein